MGAAKGGRGRLPSTDEEGMCVGLRTGNVGKVSP